MPNKDGTGPKGEGSGTGRGKGNCDSLEKRLNKQRDDKKEDKKDSKECGLGRGLPPCGKNRKSND